ncbi:hypothetical protein [Solibacillus isronensis]|uniref:hypothetical protein n=1 Tax=Solibacillus isronensis TaxID=412383 RepID=UPI002041AD98|nr:hypothetical protein [Solibacillus isronensis]MCM3722100.1 hypothetical protein [Solibacillus isronensis]
MQDEKTDISLKNNVVRILWTGGWDSTYRIVELSRQLCTVQPIYVYGDGRHSEQFEIKAMRKILLELSRRKETRATILPIEFIDKKSIPSNQEVTKAFEQIANTTRLGTQHEWLARLALLNPGLELGTESAPLEVSNILTAINKYGKLKKDENGDGFILDSSRSNKEVMLVLGNFKFPIINKAGHDMKSNIQKWGYEDIMKNVWVCHAPIFGKPCGFCHPCELKIETGMDFLLTKSALKRYARRNKKIFILNKIERRISKAAEKVIPNSRNI